MRILIGADLVPTSTNVELFQNGEGEKLVGKELAELLQGADYRIFNLETPLADIEEPIKKNGPNLIAPENTIMGYKALGVNCLTLANNHIMDQGEQGLFATMRVLKETGVCYVGGGENLTQACAPHIFVVGERKVGIYACSEHEFSIATAHSSGANPFDPLESLDHIVKLKSECDYVIVLYHGGKEHYRYPSPDLRKICRKMVQKGADVVICQHSHCIGCEEKYLQGTIVYGQGNFLFDRSESEFWQTGLLVQIGDDFDVSYIPFIKNGNTVRWPQPNEAEQILTAFQNRSAEILQEGAIEERYQQFAEEMQTNYLASISGRRSFIFRVINKLSCGCLLRWSIKRRYSNREKLILRNIIECEAHRELILYSLRKQ